MVLLVVRWRLRYTLHLRDLAEMFRARGLVFSHEAVRDREARFAPLLAERLRAKRRGQAGGRWPVDETYSKVNGALSGQLSSLAGGGVCDTRRMKEQASAPTYKRQRFPPAIIGHAVWRYCRFALRYRDVEELLAARGVVLTDETVRQWCHKFGQGYANTVRRRRPKPGDKWHRDEVFIAINGVQHL